MGQLTHTGAPVAWPRLSPCSSGKPWLRLKPPSRRRRSRSGRWEVALDAAYISAFFGLGGATIGGLTSFMTTWVSQQAQLKDQHRQHERATRHDLFKAFISEASRLYADALSHQKDDVTDLVQLYALIANMRLLVSPAVIAAAEQVLDVIVQTYLAPNRSLHEIRGLMRDGSMNFLIDFSLACRLELDRRAAR